jgi:ankyrin repeat protein
MVSAAVLIGAVGLWPEPVTIVVPGVDGVSHDMAGRDAIFHCIIDKDDEGLRRLLAEGHDLEAPVFEADGWTFLHHAVFQGNRKAVELLIAWGADVNARVKGGPSPLQIARTAGRDEIAEVLRAHGAK